MKVGRWPIFCLERMSRQHQALVDLVRPVVEGMGYELWGLEHGIRARRSLLRVYIERQDGITLGDCERVSHELTGVLDVEDPFRGPYDLEVSSPGLDRLLFTPEQFRRFAGHEVLVHMKVKLNGRRRISGRIEGVEAEAILLRTPDGEAFRVPPDLIERARLVPRF